MTACDSSRKIGLPPFDRLHADQRAALAEHERLGLVDGRQRVPRLSGDDAEVLLVRVDLRAA
jgi:hypothetical protein